MARRMVVSAMVVAGLSGCAHSQDRCMVPDWATMTDTSVVNCSLLVASDGSTVAAGCPVADQVMMSMRPDGQVGLTRSVTGGLQASYVATATTIDAATIPEAMQQILAAQTCLESDSCNRGPNPPTFLDNLRDVHVLGGITFEVAEVPQDSGGLLDGGGLLGGAGLGSALNGNPPLQAGYFTAQDTLYQVWADPTGTLAGKSVFVQALGAVDQVCPK